MRSPRPSVHYWLAIALCCFAVKRAAAADEKGGLWVALAITSNDLTKSSFEYDGFITFSDHTGLLQGTAKGFVTLKKAFYIKDKQLVRLQDISGYGYSSEVSFRADTVVRIKPLRQSFIDSIAKILDAPDKPETARELDETAPDPGRLRRNKEVEKSPAEDAKTGKE